MPVSMSQFRHVLGCSFAWKMHKITTKKDKEHHNLSDFIFSICTLQQNCTNRTFSCILYYLNYLKVGDPLLTYISENHPYTYCTICTVSYSIEIVARSNFQVSMKIMLFVPIMFLMLIYKLNC